MRERKVATLSLAMGLLALSGCVKGQFLGFFNNTGQSMVLSSERDRIQIPPGKVGRISILNEGAVLSIEQGGKAFGYKFEFPTEEYKTETATKTIYRFQIETNQLIYAILAGLEPPRARLDAQPPRFPIQPTS
jgi:hypothetical protein